MQDHELRRKEPPKIWDNTMRSTFAECPRKFYFFMRRFTYSNDTLPVYFTWGRAWHQAMLTWHTAPVSDPVMRSALAIKLAEQLWRDEGAIDKAPLDTAGNLRAKILRYVDFWGPSEEWSFVPKGGEAGWIWPLSSKWELAGAMDGYVNWPGRGLFVLEHKTTSGYLSDLHRQSYHFSTQVTGYVWYLNQLLRGENVYGAMVNMATKKIKGPKAKWKTDEFDRELVKKLPWQLEQFEEDFIRDLDDFERCWNDWVWPRRGMACYNMCAGGPGKSACLFRGICLTPLNLNEIQARGYTGIVETDEEWKPWEREGDA